MLEKGDMDNMSKNKRFKWDNVNIAIIDTQNRKEYWIDVTCIDELVDLLNDLSDNNEELKHHNQRITKVLEDGGVILTKHQLKSLIEMKNDDESSEIRHLRTANARLKDEIIALREYIQKNEMK